MSKELVSGLQLGVVMRSQGSIEGFSRRKNFWPTRKGDWAAESDNNLAAFNISRLPMEWNLGPYLGPSVTGLGLEVVLVNLVSCDCLPFLPSTFTTARIRHLVVAGSLEFWYSQDS